MIDFPAPTADANAAFGVDTHAEPLAVPALSWEELPEHRRLALAWRLTIRHERALRQGDQPCQYGRIVGRCPAGLAARLGSDGRFHIVEPGTDAPECGRSGHADSVHWVSDGRDYRVQRPTVTADWDWETRTVSWAVTLSGPEVGLEQVPRGARCPIPAAWWPGPVDQTPMGRVRGQLTELIGSACAICRLNIACCIDHNPATGYVRGYLCRDCNTRIEDCLHVSGCRFADYLNDPPALRLQVLHPHHRKRRQGARARARWASFVGLARATPALAGPAAKLLEHTAH